MCVCQKIMIIVIITHTSSMCVAFCYISLFPTCAYFVHSRFSCWQKKKVFIKGIFHVQPLRSITFFVINIYILSLIFFSLLSSCVFLVYFLRVCVLILYLELCCVLKKKKDLDGELQRDALYVIGGRWCTGSFVHIYIYGYLVLCVCVVQMINMMLEKSLKLVLQLN